MSSNSSSTTTKTLSRKQIYGLVAFMLIGVFVISYFTFSDCAICNLDNDTDENQYTYTDIAVATANSMIENATNGLGELEDLVIMDVRTQDEYDAGHLINALLFPLDGIEENIELILQYQNTTIVVHCRSGTRSRAASEILIQNNFTLVYNMLGGFNDWVDAGYPSTA